MEQNLWEYCQCLQRNVVNGTESMGGYWIGKNRNGERFAEDWLTNRCQRCGFPTHLAPVAFASAQSRNSQSVAATFIKILVESAAPKGRLGIPAASKMAPKSVSRV